MSDNTLKLTFYTDPGHGWLRVRKEVLFELGIHKDISTFSYHNGRYAYLEEDCDAPRLINKLEEVGIKVEIKGSNTNSDSHIRRFARFTPSCVLIK